MDKTPPDMPVYDHHDDDEPKTPWQAIFAAVVLFVVMSLLAFSLALAVFQ